MQEYAPEAAGGAFAQSREYYAELEEWLSGEDAGKLRHAELEEQLQARGRELLRRLHQDHLDLLAAREQRRDDVAGADGIARTRAERGHGRPLATVFGQVTVTRIAYRAPGAGNVHPLDAALNLPGEKQSHGLRKLAAVESARGSFEDAAAAIARAAGVKTGKRQVEELARWAAADVDAFYAARRPGPAPDDRVLVLTFDGKGIVMRPDALRPATAKAAAAGQNKLATRLSPGEKHGRKRMAELACVYDAAPVPRVPGDIISAPGGEKKERIRRPKAAGKWLTASVTDDIPAVIAAAFDEAERRDPQHRRTWIALADGNRTQIDAITAEAARRGVTVTVTCDFVHVLELSSTCGRQPGRSSIKATPTPKAGSASRRSRSCTARPARSRPGSAAAPPPSATRPPSAKAPTPAPATSPPRTSTWTTPLPSPKAGRSPPG